jgi:prephenate dehydratase
MQNKLIGVSGALGSFSEAAAKEYCRKNDIKNYKLEYLVTAPNVLSALDDGRIDMGIFPIENSNGGIVIESVYAMSQHLFDIKDLFEIPVIHCLLAVPETKSENIKAIASHDQALKQCKMFLRRRFPDAEIIERDDTAKAARDLSQGILSPNTAVLAPEGCAKLYGLNILEKGVQDLKFNFTSFLAVVK